jgi:CRP-like cAMP-binding protein
VVADDPLMSYEVDMWVDDYSIVPRVRSDFNSLVWYQSHRLGVPLPSPAQDLYLHDAQAEAEAARPDASTIRAGLLRSPLLSMLDDADIDRLVAASRKVRFAAGELMVESAGATRDLLVVVEGRGRMILLDPDGQESIVGDLDVGDSVGVLEGPRGSDRVLAVRAVTDCEVMVIEANAASDVTSRNAELAAAFNRLRQIRSRRLERLLAGPTGTTAASSDDETARTPEGPAA